MIVPKYYNVFIVSVNTVCQSRRSIYELLFFYFIGDQPVIQKTIINVQKKYNIIWQIKCEETSRN